MSRLPLISGGMAALGLVILGLAGPAHRLGVSLPTAFGIMRSAEYLGLAALMVGVAALVHAYRARQWGRVTIAATAILVSLTTVVIPLVWQRRAQTLPMIHDVTTDLENPPTFQAVLSRRTDATNTLDRPPQLSVLQREGYPDLAPITVSARPDVIFDRALSLAQAEGWEIVTADKSSGRIEATATTSWFGFTDDIVVRLTPWGSGTRVDVRSASRTGSGDLGRNARRIREFLDVLSE